MKELMNENYILGVSEDKEVKTIGHPTKLDLKLSTKIDPDDFGEFSGTVTNTLGVPIPNALVKLMTANYNPIYHAITDFSGNYLISNVPPGTYKLFAISKGKKLEEEGPINIGQLQNKQINFQLEDDPDVSLSIITGHVLDVASYTPVDEIFVSLVDLTNNAQELKAVTYTNKYGQFAFTEVPRAHYKLIFSKLGYITRENNIFVDVNGKIFNSLRIIEPDLNTSRGTVSGIISNEQSEPINQADVILYKVNEDNSLTPIAFTQTNESGVYLFTGVPQGNYKIKSNDLELVTVSS